jgi:hypothetical protein
MEVQVQSFLIPGTRLFLGVGHVSWNSAKLNSAFANSTKRFLQYTPSTVPLLEILLRDVNKGTFVNVRNWALRHDDISTTLLSTLTDLLRRNLIHYSIVRGPLMVAQWLRYCATDRKVAGSIPDNVIGIFHWHNPSDRTMDLGSTQPLTEMSTRSIS